MHSKDMRRFMGNYDRNSNGACLHLTSRLYPPLLVFHLEVLDKGLICWNKFMYLMTA